MVGQNQKRLTLALALLAASLSLSAQNGSEQRDSLVRLVKASSLRLEERHGYNYRMTFDATFLHNDTYLVCDTALWHVQTNIINAFGNVRIIQDETELTSDKLDYYVDDARAEFRGSLVELRDKSGNTLRTRNLDYHTKDSLAVFKGGGVMRGEDGQIIESREGTYDSKIKLFTFVDDVNMFSDTVFVRTARMEYEGDRNRAVFVSPIDFWYDDDMLSSRGGWYDREREVFFFEGNVHGTTEDQEVWADSMYVYREPLQVELLGRAQIQDPTRDVTAVAERIFYDDTLSRVTLTDNAAVALVTDRDIPEKRDTLYAAGDTLVYWTLMRFEVPEEVLAGAARRRDDIEVDAVGEFRARAAREAAAREAAAREEAERNDPNFQAQARAEEIRRQGALGLPPDGGEVPLSADDTDDADDAGAPAGEAPGGGGPVEETAGGEEPVGEETPVGEPDGEEPAGDEPSGETPEDGVAEAADSTKVGFFYGQGDIKVFRRDIQLRAGRMDYTELDSIARFRTDPVVWNEDNRQYTSDSLSILIKDGSLHKASLMSNAFIIIRETPSLYDQISGTEVMAYFDSTSALTRFDALGNSSAIFFLKENDAYATVNLVSCKMLSANLVDSELDEVFYFDSPQNNAYPLAQLAQSERTMKGFNWQEDSKPRSRWDITRMQFRESERDAYAARPRTTFRVSSQLFPGYMEGVLKQVAARRERREAGPVEAGPGPEIVLQPDGEIPDSGLAEVPVVLKAEEPDVADAGGGAPGESVSEAASPEGEISPAEPAASAPPVMSAAERRRAVRDSTIAAREAAKEARWARLDSLDAVKAAAKAEKKLKKQREATRRALIAQIKRAAREQARLERYIKYYEKKKAREARKKNGKK